MSNLTIRILFACCAIPVVFFCLWFNDFSRLAIMLFFGGAGAFEWARMISKKYSGPNVNIIALLSTVAITLGWVFESGNFFKDYCSLEPVSGIVGIITLIVIGVYIALAFAKVDISHLFIWFIAQLGAPLYLGLFAGLNVYLLGSGHGLEHSYKFIIVMTSMWICDTMAYFVGKFLAGKGPFGRHALAPTLSPKKTWEGSVGGTLFTVLWFYLWTTNGVYEVFVCNTAEALILGLLLAVAGQAGDLLMSALKRFTDTKDSSHIFPGHGGVLDRADSFFLSAPMVVLLFWFIRGGI